MAADHAEAVEAAAVPPRRRCSARVQAGPWMGLECHFAEERPHPEWPGSPGDLMHRDAVFEVSWRRRGQLLLVKPGESPTDGVLLGQWFGPEVAPRA